MSIVSQFKSREDRIEEHIKEIYFMVQEYFQDLILTGSSALFIYLKALNYQDLLVKLGNPNDVDLLVVHYEKKTPNFIIKKIGTYDYKRTPEKSITLSNGINSFDLTYVHNSTKYNRVAGLNLLTLKQLREHYKDDRADNEKEKKKKDEKKIEIIDEILKRDSMSSIGPEFNFIPPTPLRSQSEFLEVRRKDLFASETVLIQPGSAAYSSQVPSSPENGSPRQALYSSGLPNLARFHTPVLKGPYDSPEHGSPRPALNSSGLANLAQFHTPVLKGPYDSPEHGSPRPALNSSGLANLAQFHTPVLKGPYDSPEHGSPRPVLYSSGLANLAPTPVRKGPYDSPEHGSPRPVLYSSGLANLAPTPVRKGPYDSPEHGSPRPAQYSSRLANLARLHESVQGPYDSPIAQLHTPVRKGQYDSTRHNSSP